MEQRILTVMALASGIAGAITGPMVGVADFWVPLSLGIAGAIFTFGSGLVPKNLSWVTGAALLLAVVAIAFGIIAYSDFQDIRESIVDELQSN